MEKIPMMDLRSTLTDTYEHKRAELEAKQAEVGKLQAEVVALQKAMQALGFEPKPMPIPTQRWGSYGQAAELTRSLLKEAFPQPMRSAELRGIIEQATGRVYNENTVRQNLWRLKRDGLARVEGRLWYWVPPLSLEISSLTPPRRAPDAKGNP